MLSVVATLSLNIDPARLPSLDVRVKQAAVSTALAAVLTATAPVMPVQATPLEDAIVEVSEAAYPIIRNLNAETFGPFVSKTGKILLDANIEAATFNAGLDYYNSIPSDKVDATAATVKDAFAGLSPGSCTLVPQPPAALWQRIVSTAKEKADPEKLKTFSQRALTVVKPIQTQGDLVCLPPSSAITKAALAQADAAAAADPALAKAFGAQLGVQFKKLPSGKILPLAGEAQSQTMSASLQERTRFKKAGLNVEKAAKAAAKKAALAMDD